MNKIFQLCVSLCSGFETLHDPISRFADTLAFASWTASGPRISVPRFKFIVAGKTYRSLDKEFLLLRSYGAGNMRQMRIDLFFPDSDIL